MRWFLRLILPLVVITSIVACGDSNDTEQAGDPGMPHQSTATADMSGMDHSQMLIASPGADESQQMQVQLVASELVVGQNRFAVGLTTSDNAIIDDADVNFEYFDISDSNNPTIESSATATKIVSDDGHVVIYAHERSFDRAGAWGVRVDAHLPDGTSYSHNISFEVLEDSPTLKVGEQAPAVDNPTANDVGGDLTKLTSASKPNPAFYEMSIADALANDKPTVVLFATPAFCQTRFCGPDYEIVSDLQQRYGDQFNAIHVEVYSGLPNPAANGWQLASPMGDFGLQTEPWLYVIDADGTVTWRVEGLFTEQEVVGALADIGIK